MKSDITYATVCSGIGAPEAAWADLWGPPEFTAEIEAFPSAVLKHHYPDVPNYGDMTKYKEWPEHDLDVLIGGTPCQAFSVAGLRRSLEDDRGNLTITFLGLIRKYQPRFTVWENVPGVLNISDNAFGQFLSGLVGFDSELRPTGGRWTNSGFIVGPERVAAWRILNAEYFGVPQRRRRVFVIANPRNMGFASCQILFEPTGVQRDIETSGKEGESITALTSCDVETCGADDQKAQGRHLIACNNKSRALTAPNTATGRLDPNEQEFICFTQEQEPKWEGGDKKAHTLGTYNGRKQCIAIHARQDPISVKDKALPLDVKGNTQAIAIQDGRGLDKHQNGLGINEGGPSYTIDQTGSQSVATQSIVRRLTPMECERLQGFPDGYTLIPGKHKFKAEIHKAILQFIMRHFNLERSAAISLAGNPDGPRYKALGNSMAKPVIKWIGRRIQIWEDLSL